MSDINYTSANYASRHDPPEGYAWTGEYRDPTDGEWFLSDGGEVLDAVGSRYGDRHILRKVEKPKFVNVTALKTIWVTLPGDNAGHALTEAQANQLVRELELAVA